MGHSLKQYPIIFVTILTVVIILAAIAARSGASAEINQAEGIPLLLELFASGLDNPVSITNAGAGDGRLFVNEKEGRIRIVQAEGRLVSEPFLDISGRVTSEGEEGLLGLAFHPNYASNGYFFVNYTNLTKNVRRTRISRYRVSDDPNLADPNSEDILLTVIQPASNHNAGDIHFGPDGYLYIPLGDGGGGGDQDNNAQNLVTILGKIVRIDVDSLDGNLAADCPGIGSGNYRIPAKAPTPNPFIDTLGACDEIWATGLRNPWRSSFDRLTGDFYIGDVGQNQREEIDFQPEDSRGGENYGWRCYEGSSPFNLTGCGSIDSYRFPIFDYAHIEATDRCSGSVTGGYVYRGSKYPSLYGRYFLVDFCQGTFWDLERVGDIWRPTEHLNVKEAGYSAFGQDSQGEIYLANMFNGNLYRLEGPPEKIEVAGYLPLTFK